MKWTQHSPSDAVSECPVCGCPDGDYYRPYKSSMRILERTLFSGISIRECKKCSHRFGDPIPPEYILENYYKSFYWGQHRKVADFVGPTEPIEEWRDTRAIGQNSFYSKHLAASFPSGKSLSCLDIGAGAALSLRRLKLMFDVKIDVIEPSSEYQDYYKTNQIECIGATLNAVDQSAYSGKYDLVSSSHVLEHVHRPFQFVSCAVDLLKTGGFLFIEVPNCNKDWEISIRSDSPHTQFFTAHSLRYLFELNDLIVVDCVETGFSTSEMLRLMDRDMTREEMLSINSLGERNVPRQTGGWLRVLGQKQ